MSKPILFLYIWVLLFCIPVLGQSSFPDCEYHYFKNKAVSTAICFDKDKRWGIAKAYDKMGQLIYKKELRRVAGHSTVSFTYYEDGAVHTAIWSSAPDGGIQWYHTTTTFCREGKVLDEIDNSYDMSPSLRTNKFPGEHQPQEKDK